MKLKALCVSIGLLAAVGGTPAHACTGTGCLQIFSTQDGGGALTVFWDFENKKVQTFRSFCGATECVYGAGDPGFRTPPEPPPDGYFALADGTNVSLEPLSIDPAVIISVGGVLEENVPVLLGTAPTLHKHPTWQLKVPVGVTGDYPFSFRLTTDSPAYAASQAFRLLLTNLPTPTPGEPEPTATPTPTATPHGVGCTGDCDDNGRVSVDELVRGVSAALGQAPMCPPLDLDGDGAAEISELVAAVNASLRGCSDRPAATLDEIQSTIFTPSCAVATCHDATSETGHLILDGADRSYDQLIGVEPDMLTARQAGRLRVDPGHPENSFLLIKVDGPPPDQGSRMPLTGPVLAPAQIQLIRDWIAQGAAR